MEKNLFDSPEYITERYLATKEDLKFLVYYLASPLFVAYWFTTDLVTVPNKKFLGLALRLTIPIVGTLAIKCYKFAFLKKHYLIPVMLFLIFGIAMDHAVFALDFKAYDYNKYFSTNNLVMVGATIFTPLPVWAISFLGLLIYLPYIAFVIINHSSFSYHDYVQNLNAMFGTIVLSLVYTHFKIKRIKQNYVQKRALLNDANVGARISQITHDLRSPLQALIIAKESKDSASAANLLNAGLKRIQNLCQEILETHTSPYFRDQEITTQDIKQLIATECTLFLPQNYLIFNFKSSNDKLYLDASKIQRLVTNLVSNAYKAVANQQNPKIVVDINITTAGVALKVVDNGIGFAAYNKAKETDLAKAGYGIGLEFCKQVCDYYGGTLEIKSEFGHTEISTFLKKVFL